MIDQKAAERLAREAKHSMAVFVGFLGAGNPNAMGIFLKWPDALDSYVSGKEDLFRQDIATLITVPIRLVVESLVERTNSRGIAFEVEEAMRMSQLSPVATKKQLIRLGNIMIEKLNAKGKVMIPIGAYLEEPS